MSSIVVYFSHQGSNWVKDKISILEVGNCEILAKYIQSKTKSDIFKIRTKHKYTNDYYKTTEEAKKELNENIHPELVEYLNNFDKYNKVYLVYPIWWDTCPMAVVSFLEHYDFNGKTILPFCTHEGSGVSNSVNDIRKHAKNAIVKDAYETRGYRCQSLENDDALKTEIDVFCLNR